MRNIKARTLWLLVLVTTIIAVGLIIACANTSDSLNKTLVVLMVIDFVFITFLIQAAISKSIKFKPKKIKYNEKTFKAEFDIENKLNELKFNLRDRAYGNSYIKIEDTNANKVVLVFDNDKYFNNTEPEKQDKELSKKLDKCNTFIGLEIFLNSDDEVLEKISDFSIQGDKVYYTALLKISDNTFKCFNYLEPNDKHNDNLNKLFKDLGLVLIDESSLS